MSEESLISVLRECVEEHRAEARRLRWLDEFFRPLAASHVFAAAAIEAAILRVEAVKKDPTHAE